MFSKFFFFVFCSRLVKILSQVLDPTETFFFIVGVRVFGE